MKMRGNVLVSGGGRGIGKGILQELAKEGFSAGFCTRSDPEEFSPFIEELTTLSRGKDRVHLVSDFLSDFFTVGVLVNPLRKRRGEPSDAGRTVKMLLSGNLAYSTGQVIRIDGGLSVERF